MSLLWCWLTKVVVGVFSTSILRTSPLTGNVPSKTFLWWSSPNMQWYPVSIMVTICSFCTYVGSLSKSTDLRLENLPSLTNFCYFCLLCTSITFLGNSFHQMSLLLAVVSRVQLCPILDPAKLRAIIQTGPINHGDQSRTRLWLRQGQITTLD